MLQAAEISKGSTVSQLMGVFPSAGETERRVDETADVHAEGTVDWVQDSQLSESLHHEVSRVACQWGAGAIGC